MSTQMVELPSAGNVRPEENAQRSLTHWVWTPYIDINNMQAWGVNSLLGYRDQVWTKLERCTPYPLGNMTQREADRATVAEAHEAGYSVNAEQLPKLEYIKYAQSQANELGETYAHDHGLRVLTPLTGMDDYELVTQIVQAVQPFKYDIHEMEYEFTEGAKERIRKSNLSKADRDKAEALAVVMLGGAQRAKIKAESEYELLISSMSDASVGKPGISNPTPFHAWICRQLNKPVPERINRMAGQQQPVVVMQQDSKQIDELKAQIEELKSMLPKKRTQVEGGAAGAAA